MNGKELDSYTYKYGIRGVELIREPIEEGESFIFSINKRKVFCKGANWVPADALPANVSKEKYRRLLELAAKANINMFRIPGLSIYEDPLFYQLCDAHGIMIWQDFMFGNALYPGDDPEFIAEVETEARTIVKQLRNHPCRVLWCGSNEMTQKESHKGKKHYGLVIYRDLLPEICRELDPSRVYRPTSAYGIEGRSSEEAGDRHTGPKDQKSLAYYKGYALDRGKFISEFYQYGIPVKESLLEFIPPEQLYVNSPVWKFHNNTGETGIIKSFLENYFIPEEKLSVDEYILSSQMMQAETFKLALDHWRRRMFTTAGSLFWMYSDCWGTTGGWTIVDYYLRLKPSYFYVKRAFEPVHISIKQSDPAEVWILNDTYSTYPVDIEYGIMNFKGRILTSEHKREELPVAGARLIGRIDTAKIAQQQRSNVFCYSRLYSKDKLVSQDRIFLVDFKDLELPKPAFKVKLQRLNDLEYKLRLSSESFAWMVNVELPEGAELSDNCFDMFPGDERQINIRTSSRINLEDINVSCMNQIVRKHKK
jgi:beta-mannosidase